MTRADGGPTPRRVSVVIPAYHSDATLAACLDALREQSFRDFETILVNSSDESRTAEIVRRFPEVRFEQSATRLFPHAARNRGVELARGDLLVFTDPDCRARADWLERLLAAHQAGHAVVGGGMDLASTRWLERGVHLVKFFWLLPGLAPGRRWILPTANVLYPRLLLDRIGPFDGAIFCGDALQSWRAEAAGVTLWFEPGAVVEHRHEGNLAGFCRERWARGREFGAVRAEFERWGRLRALATALAAPWAPLLTIGRAGAAAVRTGWGRAWLLTLPVQIVGQLAWSLGEARACVLAFRQGTGRSPTPGPADG